MSDGLTDGYRTSLATERRCMLLRSVLAALKNAAREVSANEAVNDLMFYQEAFYRVEKDSDREAAACSFLDRLRDNEPEPWSRLLTFALETNKVFGGAELQELKDLSPFKGLTLVLAYPSYHGIRFRATRDLEDRLATFLPQPLADQTGGTWLVAFDLAAKTAVKTKD